MNLIQIGRHATLTHLVRGVDWLETKQKRKIFLVVVLQILLSILDLVGVALIGLVASLSVSSLQDTPPNSSVQKFLEFVGLGDASPQSVIMIFGISSVVILVGRSIASLVITKKILFFFSRRSSDLSINLSRRLFRQQLAIVQKRSSQETLYALTKGTEFIMIQVLGTCTVLVADIAVLILLLTGLMIFDPVTALSTFIIFFLVASALNRVLFTKASVLGEDNATFTIAGNTAINDSISAYREAFVSGRFAFYIEQISKARRGLAEVSGSVNFMPYISKYVLEATVIVGALLIVLIQLILGDPGDAIASLSIFLASGTRIGPSVLRLQQGLVYIRNSLGMAAPTLAMMETLQNQPAVELEVLPLERKHDDFIPEIQIEGLTFSYTETGKKIVEGLDLLIPSGSYVVIVGSSGVGKSTLVDLILGLLQPETGSVNISGDTSSRAIKRWPGAVGYVPQETVIVDGSIRDNLLMAYTRDALQSQELMHLLGIVQMDRFVLSLDSGLDSNVGERGSKLSGGQRQRIGIARALITNPKILILDEATSSLDAETERAIAESLSVLRGSITIVEIAHRIQSIKKADIIIHLTDNGKSEIGNFEELAAKSESFRKTIQINL
jgi:ABC-type multidrug transport system fused ATPase/permease subunit